ncbi:restriction endonuclease subunit S [Pedobacter sp. KACC 23697]|uniref:Restriction endonuclease subunit S n=1 Tax=Pedobacter sp. KACC 23697 TaxID=3149230 RepID=A0AAU7KA07_9SPHI
MKLLEKHFEIALETPDGVAQLRKLVLKLAMQGKLVEQNLKEQSAHKLIEDINKEKVKLIKLGQIRKQKELKIVENDEVLYQLPSNWKWVRLNDFGTWKSGSTPDRSNSTFYNGNIPWVKSGEVKQGLINETSEKISELALKKCSLDLNPIGSVLVAMYGANIGEVGVLEIEAATNQAVCACQTFSLINNKYLFNLILSLKQNFISQGAGAAQPNISREKIINTVVPLPPLEEQKRIVEKIDQLMLLCDKLEAERNRKTELQLQMNSAAISNLIKANNEISFNNTWKFITSQFDTLYNTKKNVNDLKSVILELAIRGKLVKQDRNQSAQVESKLIKQEKDSINGGKTNPKLNNNDISINEIPFEIPENWVWVRLGNICSKIGSGSTPRGGKNVYKDEGIKFIRSQNVYNFGLVFDNVAFIDSDTHQKMSNTKVISKDLLLNITGGSIGRCALVPDDFGEANVSQHVTIIRLLNRIDNRFIHHYILSPYFQDKIMQVQTGANREGLAKKNMELMLVPLPPYEVQKKIANRVNELFKLCEMLEKNIEQTSKKQSQILNAVLAQV